MVYSEELYPGKFYLSMDNPWKDKLHARISLRIREKIVNYFLTFISVRLGVDSWKKGPTNLCYSPFKPCSSRSFGTLVPCTSRSFDTPLDPEALDPPTALDHLAPSPLLLEPIVLDPLGPLFLQNLTFRPHEPVVYDPFAPLKGTVAWDFLVLFFS